MILNTDALDPKTDDWNFLFTNDSGGKITKKIGSLLKTGLTKALGLSLNVSVYRQMAVMVADHKKFNFQQYETNTESDILDQQAGHSTLTSHTHYAVNSNTLGALTRGSAANFYECSLSWQRLF